VKREGKEEGKIEGCEEGKRERGFARYKCSYSVALLVKRRGIEKRGERKRDCEGRDLILTLLDEEVERGRGEEKDCEGTRAAQRSLSLVPHARKRRRERRRGACSVEVKLKGNERYNIRYRITIFLVIVVFFLLLLHAPPLVLSLSPPSIRFSIRSTNSRTLHYTTSSQRNTHNTQHTQCTTHHNTTHSI
jgi:hypothetical protein